MKVTFMADKVQVNTNQVGGNNKIIFHTGEYEKKNIAGLMVIPDEVNLKVTVEWE